MPIKINDIHKLLEIQPKDITVLLLGAPGIGKSEIIIEYAREQAEKYKLTFVDLDEVQSSLPTDKKELKQYYVFKDFRLTDVADVTDLVGFPQVRDEFAEYAPWRWIYYLANAGAGLLFLDEITNVQRPDILAASYKITNDRKIGFSKLPKSVQIIAAGNLPEHSPLASALPLPLLSRMQIIMVQPPSVQEWITHMSKTYGGDWDTRVAAYLSKMSDKFIKIPKTRVALEGYPVPRSWTRLARKLKHTPPELMDDMIASFIGETAGAEFVAFLQHNINIVELLADPRKFSDLSLDQKWLAMAMLANMLIQLSDPATLKDKPPQEIEQIKKTKEAINDLITFIIEHVSAGVELIITMMLALPLTLRTQLYVKLKATGKVDRIKALGDALQAYASETST